MDSKWFPPQNRPCQPVGPTIGATYGLCFVSLLLPRGVLRRALAIPPVLCLLYNLQRHTAGVWEQDYLAAIQVTIFLVKVTDLCIVHDAERDFRRLNIEGDDAEAITRMSVWQKFWWKFDLWTSLRGIGWNWEVKNVPENKETSGRYDWRPLVRCTC